MRTIMTYEEDSSAMARINPGPSSTSPTTASPAAASRSTRLRSTRGMPRSAILKRRTASISPILAEHGYVGLGLFLIIWFLAFRLIGRLRRRSKDVPQAKWIFDLANMCQVSLIGYAVGGTFLSLAYFDLPYNIVVLLVVANRWLDEKPWVTERQVVVSDVPPKALYGRQL